MPCDASSMGTEGTTTRGGDVLGRRKKLKAGRKKLKCWYEAVLRRIAGLEGRMTMPVGGNAGWTRVRRHKQASGRRLQSDRRGRGKRRQHRGDPGTQ
eukprot:1195261-Prorocentrum_minimum.AAC.7